MPSASAYDYYDSDDSLPTSPKPRPRSSSWPTPRRILSRIRRSRPLIIVALSIFAIYYYFQNYHHHLFPPVHAPSLRYKNVNWRYYAYSQYATDSHYLCNSVMVFEALDRLGSKADRILMYPEEWDSKMGNKTHRDSQLLAKARDQYGVKLIPVKVLRFPRVDKEGNEDPHESTWSTSLTKLHTFNQTQYLRILHLDSDITLLQHLDSLFLLPPSPIAMMRAYWSPKTIDTLTSFFLLLQPSTLEFNRLISLASNPSRSPGDFDMEILNTLYATSALVLPHRNYGLLTGEFRSTNHEVYLGNDYEKWDPKRALREASVVHFSDWPLPKPWIMWPQNLLGEMVPRCEYMAGTKEEQGCEGREGWLELYNEFRRRRKDVCGLLSVPAPTWPPMEKKKGVGGKEVNGKEANGKEANGKEISGIETNGIEKSGKGT